MELHSLVRSNAKFNRLYRWVRGTISFVISFIISLVFEALERNGTLAKLGKIDLHIIRKSWQKTGSYKNIKSKKQIEHTVCQFSRTRNAEINKEKIELNAIIEANGNKKKYRNSDINKCLFIEKLIVDNLYFNLHFIL